MPHARVRVPVRLRAVAVVAALTFGCVTVRAPASTIAGEVPVEGGRAAPQLELWIESNKAVPPEEATQATAEARAALAEALEGVPAPGDDMLLVVRARGVTRTAGRRSDQQAAMAGLVVLVVIGLVAIIASGKGGGGGGGASKVAGAAARGGVRPPPPLALAGRLPLAGVPRPGFVPEAGLPRPGPEPAAGMPPSDVPVAATSVRPPPAGPWQAPAPRPPPPGSAPGPALAPDRGPHLAAHGGFDAHLGRYPDEPYLEEPYLEAPAPAVMEEHLSWTEAPWLAEPEASPEPAAPWAIRLVPPPPLPVQARGFFQGDSLQVELTLVDRATGQPRWRKTIEREVDPRSAPAVKRVLDEALVAADWTALDRAGPN
jgi:hypothetical protein